MIRVFLVVDHPATRAVLRLRLELEADIVVVGESGYDEATVAHLRSRTPNVVLLDVPADFPHAGSAGARLRDLALSGIVVVLTLYNDTTTRRRVLAAGAREVVCKHDTDGLLLAAIRAAAVQCPQADSDL